MILPILLGRLLEKLENLYSIPMKVIIARLKLISSVDYCLTLSQNLSDICQLYRMRMFVSFEFWPNRKLPCEVLQYSIM